MNEERPPRLDPNDHDLWALLKKIEADGQLLIAAFWGDQDNRRKSTKVLRRLDSLLKSTQALKDAYHNSGALMRHEEELDPASPTFPPLISRIK